MSGVPSWNGALTFLNISIALTHQATFSHWCHSAMCGQPFVLFLQCVQHCSLCLLIAIQSIEHVELFSEVVAVQFSESVISSFSAVSSYLSSLPFLYSAHKQKILGWQNQFKANQSKILLGHLKKFFASNYEFDCKFYYILRCFFSFCCFLRKKKNKYLFC